MFLEARWFHTVFANVSLPKVSEQAVSKPPAIFYIFNKSTLFFGYQEKNTKLLIRTFKSNIKSKMAEICDIELHFSAKQHHHQGSVQTAWFVSCFVPEYMYT